MSFNKLNSDEIIAKKNLTLLFPTCSYAVDQIVNEISNIGPHRFRDGLIFLANKPEFKKQINQYVQDVNKKFIKANDRNYLKLFIQMWEEENQHE